MRVQRAPFLFLPPSIVSSLGLCLPMALLHSPLFSDADIVCARAKIHFEPGSSLEMSETGTLDSGRIQTTLQQNKAAFKPLHPTQSRLMYFSVSASLFLK